MHRGKIVVKIFYNFFLPTQDFGDLKSIYFSLYTNMSVGIMCFQLKIINLCNF